VGILTLRSLLEMFHIPIQRILAAALLLCIAAAQAQNPIPQIVGPTHPTAVAPGSGAFALSVYGANFAPGATVNWNYQPRATTFVSAHELQAQILSTDVEQNTAGFITVTNPPPGGGDSSSNWAQVEVHDPITAFTFEKPIVNLWGGWLMLPADFNHDTLLDLVGQNGTDLVLSYGKTSGIFQFASVAGYFYDGATGGTYGDFNNDGLLDIAYVMGTNPGVAAPQINVMLGQSNGQFELGSQIKDHPLFSNVVTGDFNGDGKLDLLGMAEESIRTYLGNGDGTFTHLKDYHGGGVSTVVADFNGDGKLDLAYVNLSGGNGFVVQILYGKGDGTFSPTAQTVATVTGAGLCGFLNALQVSDLNGDGIPDLVFCTPNQIGVILSKGKGSFEPPVFINVENPQFTFAIADLNADGKPDLLVSETNDDVFYLYLGNGDGTFQSAQTISFDPAFDAELGMVVGDFGSKGTLGLAIPSGYSTAIYTQH
jgi:hypothetical protein